MEPPLLNTKFQENTFLGKTYSKMDQQNPNEEMMEEEIDLM